MRGLVSCYEAPAAEVGRGILARRGTVAAAGEAVLLDARRVTGSRATPDVFASRYVGRKRKAGG